MFKGGVEDFAVAGDDWREHLTIETGIDQNAAFDVVMNVAMANADRFGRAQLIASALPIERMDQGLRAVAHESGFFVSL